MSVLTLAPAASPVTASPLAGPAAAFALAGASGNTGGIGGVEQGVEQYGHAELEALAGRENSVVFRKPATVVTKASISVEVANVRSGPGLDYDKIGKLPNGVVVTLVERKSDWFQVRSPAGATGWVAQEVLAVNEAAAAEVVAAKSTPAKPAALQAVTNGGNVNLRRGPGTQYASLGKLPRGTSVDLLGRQSSWYRVETPAGVLGWVTADYLRMPAGVADRVPAAGDKATIVAPAPAAAASSVPTGMVSSGKSNLRTGPSTAFPSIAQLTRNTPLTLVARHGDWLKVRTTKGALGWISGALLDVSAATLRRVPTTNDVPAAPAKAAPAPAPVIATGNRWVWPTQGRISSGFGRRWGVLHNGVDIANRKWTQIKAARAGTVIQAGWCSGYGYCVMINHGDGFVTEYGHMAARPNVRTGQRVAAGTLIGAMGSTFDRRGGGYASGVHLHFTVKRYGRAINPLKYLP